MLLCWYVHAFCSTCSLHLLYFLFNETVNVSNIVTMTIDMFVPTQVSEKVEKFVSETLVFKLILTTVNATVKMFILAFHYTISITQSLGIISSK